MEGRSELVANTGQQLSTTVIEPVKGPVVIEGEYTEIKGAKQQEVDPVERAVGPKLGEGHVAGMFRLGLKELGQALKAFPDSNIGGIEESGIAGNLTPQMVSQQMGFTIDDMAHRAQFQNRDNSLER